MHEFFYKWLDNGTFAVMEYHGDEKNVIIPDTYCGAPVSLLFDKLFAGHTEIESVNIPDTVTDIGEFLFEGCENLRHIKLPDALESIWPYAFTRSGIEEITIPEKVVSLPPCTFMDCKNLKTLNCNINLKKIYAWALGGCESLTEFNHENTVQIDPKAFERR
ncbi:MAG: leucine-rich repeat domain-containing protein [Clostridia bacterium]|nr:leucine-rich repeat domain-containing protein [Clostridia bacterium]